MMNKKKGKVFKPLSEKNEVWSVCYEAADHFKDHFPVYLVEAVKSKEQDYIAETMHWVQLKNMGIAPEDDDTELPIFDTNEDVYANMISLDEIQKRIIEEKKKRYGDGI